MPGLRRARYDIRGHTTHGPAVAVQIRMQWGDETGATGANLAPAQTPTEERYVLVVDDNPGIRRMLTRGLGLNRYRAVEASSIAEAVAFADNHSLSAVILDLHLGTQNGLELLAMLRVNPRHRATPVLILTGSGAVTDDQEALIQRNAAHLFYKPQPLSDLVAHIGRLSSARDQTDVAVHAAAAQA
jgi:DNA-binding response OmpR family regulator